MPLDLKNSPCKPELGVWSEGHFRKHVNLMIPKGGSNVKSHTDKGWRGDSLRSRGKRPSYCIWAANAERSGWWKNRK